MYCLEFDSSRIITGSRDRTIKVWSLKTGRCLATFAGHRGSVLCLKFDRDWDILDDDCMDVDNAPRKGFMVSGSSDCTVCVWDLWAVPTWGGEPSITAEVRAVLPAHSGGVLDLRIDSRWIVSWYVIRVAMAARLDSALTSCALVPRTLSSASGTARRSTCTARSAGTKAP